VLTRLFFRAADGIRDFHVTGVQTCALPILFREGSSRTGLLYQCAGGQQALTRGRRRTIGVKHQREGSTAGSSSHGVRGALGIERSEERRVGKERSVRWWASRQR